LSGDWPYPQFQVKLLSQAACASWPRILPAAFQQCSFHWCAGQNMHNFRPIFENRKLNPDSRNGLLGAVVE
jgi:hypothetical protein